LVAFATKLSENQFAFGYIRSAPLLLKTRSTVLEVIEENS